MTKLLEERILEIWNKHSDPSLLTKNLHEIIQKENIYNAKQTLSQIFINILSQGFCPSEYLSTLLKHCISTEFIPEFIFFEELSKNSQTFENENFMTLCFEIFEEFLPQMTNKNRKRKHDIDQVVHHESFLFQFLQFFGNKDLMNAEENENLQKCIELLEKLDFDEKLLKTQLDSFENQYISDKLYNILEKKQNSTKDSFSPNFFGKSWKALELLFQLEIKPVFIEHLNFNKSKEVLKNFQKFKKMNNSSFLVQIWLGILKYSVKPEDEYISQLFFFWKLPKLLDEIIVDEIEINEALEIFSTLNFDEEVFQKIKKHYFNKKTEISIKTISKCVELIRQGNVEHQSEIIKFIFETNCLQDGKNLNAFVSLLNEGEKFLDFVHFHGKIIDLLDVLLINLIQLESKKTGNYSDYFQLLFSIIIRFNLLTINRNIFVKILKKNSTQQKSDTISWFSSLVFGITFNPESPVIDSLSNEVKNSKFKKYTFGEIISSNYRIVEIFKSDKNLLQVYNETFGDFCDTLTRYSMSKLDENEIFIKKKFLTSPSLSLKEEFKKVFSNQQLDFINIAFIFDIIGVHKFIKIVLQEMIESSNNTNDSIRSSEIAGYFFSVIQTDEDFNYLLEYLQIYVSKFGEFSISSSLAYFLSIGLSINPPKDEIIEVFNQVIKELVDSEKSSPSNLIFFAQQYKKLNE
eukprot:gene5674-9495_t